MISNRTKHSLAQFLALFESPVVVVMINKYADQDHHPMSCRNVQLISELIFTSQPQTLLSILSEVAATQNDLRARISPKVRYDERWHDLEQCLVLDGYAVEDKRLVQTDPSIASAPPVDDDLMEALKTCGAPHASQIIQLIEASNSSFRLSPPDYNASLTNARVALETLAADVAGMAVALQPPPYDPTKWGSVISHIRQTGEISTEEEKGLAGVYGFLSAGAHRPLGLSEVHMTRLGRTLALNMCWFLLKNRAARQGQP